MITLCMKNFPLLPIGTDLLVKPITSAKQTSVDIYFPGGPKEV